MKIIDENGSVVENPDLTAGYLAADTEAVEHPAQDAVEEAKALYARCPPPAEGEGQGNSYQKRL